MRFLQGNRLADNFDIVPRVELNVTEVDRVCEDAGCERPDVLHCVPAGRLRPTRQKDASHGRLVFLQVHLPKGRLQTLCPDLPVAVNSGVTEILLSEGQVGLFPAVSDGQFVRGLRLSV